ncbi:MAG: hypothetical protein K2P77_05800 [Burkholderiaceae bacterium]|nr:hypothetical protein [Burkholderiaceae bacterium]
MDDRLAWQDTNVNEMNQVLPLVEGAASAGTSAAASAAAAALSAASALAAPGTNATSTTPLTVSAGVLAFVIQANKDFAPGAWLMCARTSDPDGVWMLGQLRSYTKATGALSLVVAPGDTKGTGTFNDWTLSLSSARSTVFNAVDLSLVGPSIPPSLLCDFSNSKRLDPRFTYAMASPQTYFDSTGTLRTAPAGVPAFNHDPATGRCPGIQMWPAGINSLRNNTMQGAAAGVPGADPTNWIVAANAGVTKSVVGTGTENGIKYIDLRFVFGSAGSAYITFDQLSAIAALIGQTWTSSAYVSIAAGSLANLTANRYISEYTSGNVFLAETVSAFVPTAGALNMRRTQVSRTLSSPTVARVTASLGLVSNGSADITLRIGLPQMEQWGVATPAIETTNAAVSRSAPTLTIPTSAFDYNPAEGTLYVEGDYSVVAGGNATLVRFDDGTDNNRIMLRIASGAQRLQSVTGGVVDVDLILGTPSVGVPTRVVAAYRVNDFSASRDGASVVTDSSAAVPALTTLRIGGEPMTNHVGGHIAKFAYYSRRLVVSEQAALSTL